MICKYCAHETPDDSVFCCHCGERLARKKREKSGKKVYPKFRVLADGSLLGQLMVDGKRETIKAANEAEYRAKIDALRTGVMEMKAHPEKRSLQKILRDYIDKNDGVLSPATIRGYEYIYKGRFRAYMQQEAGKIDYQQMVNDEAKKYAPKTVENAWALVSPAFRDAGIPVPEVNLPTVPESDEDFLDFEQIHVFIAAIRGDQCEREALLMLHSLRMSELLKLDASDIRDEQIHVRGAVVVDKNNKMVEKETNKTKASTREIPIMIPRLNEILPAEGPIPTRHPTVIADHIKNACKKAGLPECSPHDLRRSFASLAYHLGWPERVTMLIGGWDSPDTVHRIYIKLSKKDVSAAVEIMKNYYEFQQNQKKPVIKPL